MCAGDNLNYTLPKKGTYEIYEELVDLGKYDITIYSGDSDPAVPYSGTISWINQIRKELDLATEEYWRPWFTETVDGKQNSGNVWALSKKLKLVSFKGVGHMAPQWDLQGGQKMIHNLIHGDPL